MIDILIIGVHMEVLRTTQELRCCCYVCSISCHDGSRARPPHVGRSARSAVARARLTSGRLIRFVGPPARFKQALETGVTVRKRLNGYLAQRVPSIFLAGSFRTCFNRAVPESMFPWRARYPLSHVPIKPVPNS